MKLVVIGDLHGRDIWKKIVKKEKDADKFIFIGDYFDSFDISFMDQMNNFKNLMTFKEKNTDKVVMLVGNHEFHYISKEECYSGHQHFKAEEISAALHNAIKDDSIHMAYKNGDYLFTHAGVTKTWCKNHGINENNLCEDINELFKKDCNVFRFQAGKNKSNYGDDITQSPIWVRPPSLSKDFVEGVIHVVGHTPQPCIKSSPDIIWIDTFDKINEYLIINDGLPTIGIVK